ncbi:cytochrome c [Pseudenhygromyxa sp. WMMC2535]|uniref:c-type cytochrome n=1 Tax=Pseudenhygromyxa sp. WMMC2535 TaxID=2712867 RepID=UPI001595F03A|nr:cytochrome c [Pseudenhygromyxa sp. WMMC2535]NVB43163.1 cytochrome c [Pseudenhygromyxa sp. WMMC2535]
MLLGLTLTACAGDDGDDGDDDDVGEDGSCNAEQSARVDDVLSLTADGGGNGAIVYASTCGSSGCHGVDGMSGPAPSLVDEIPEYDDEALGCLLLTGYGNMASQASLSDQELADVIAYVESTF